MTSSNERYTFIVRWQDGESSLSKKYVLHCYFDNSIELIDMKNCKMFLRRVICDGVKISNICVGDVVDIFSRRMEVVQYGDLFTQQTLEAMTQKTVALIKADSTVKVAHMFLTIISKECKITKMKMIQLTKEDAIYFCKDQENTSDRQRLVEELVISPVVALEITGKSAVAKWQEVMNPEFSEEARAFGTKDKRIALYGSTSTDKYETDKSLLFLPKSMPSKISSMPTALLKDCTLAIIKPHAVTEGLYPKIMLKIQSMKFKITAIQMYHMNRSEAEELFEIYRGVLPEFKEMIDQFISGPCIGLELGGFGSETVPRFREAVGPRDPDVAKLLRPQSIRAEFGTTIPMNAIYCTDLDSDGVPESEYFFNFLQA